MTTAPPLARRAYDALRERLESRRIRPGDLLNRRDVAADLGMSVAPVLEAMLRLENEGFLETLPRKGTRVRVIDREALRGQHLVREALECQAVRLASGAPLRQAVPTLLPLARRIDGLRVDDPAMWPLDLELHRALVQRAETPALLETFDRVMRPGFFHAINALIPDGDGRPLSPHVDLLRRLRTAGPDAAEAVVRRHLRAGKDAILGRR